MLRFLRFCLSIFFRAFLPLLFFLGGAGLILWAQGWRFDLQGRTFVPTGVLSVSSVPDAARVFMGGKPLGVTPQIFLGLPIGNAMVCLQKTGYQTFCSEAEFTSQLAYRIHNIYLLPQFPQARPVGPAALISWDPFNRGFLRFYPELADFVAFNGRDFRFLENIPFDPEAVIGRRGELISLTASPQPLFSGAPVPAGSRFFDHGYLYAKGAELFFYDGIKDAESLVTRFEEDIEDAFFLAGSESAIIVLPSSFLFLPRIGATPIPLFSKSPASPLRYFPQSQSFFWEENGTVYSFAFDAQNIL